MRQVMVRYKVKPECVADEPPAPLTQIGSYGL